MRVMLVLLVLAVAGAGVAVVLGERDDGGSFYGWRPHAPESADEKAAARVAVAYALAIVKGDSARACTYAAGESFRRLRCASRPRRDRYLYANGEVRAYHVGSGRRPGERVVGRHRSGAGACVRAAQGGQAVARDRR